MFKIMARTIGAATLTNPLVPNGAIKHAEIIDEILSALPDGVFILDRFGRYLYANKPAAESFGRTQSDIIGMTWRELDLSTEAIELLEDKIKNVFATGKPATFEIEAPMCDGSSDHLYILRPLMSDNGGVGAVVATIKDVAEQKRVEKENARLYDKALVRARTFEALSQVGNLLTSTLSMKETLEQVTDYSALLLDVPSTVVMLLEKKMGVFRVAASQGLPKRLVRGRLTLGEVESLGLDKPMLRTVSDLAALSATPFFSMEAEEGFRSALMSPLFIEGILRGLLIIQDKRRFEPSEEDLAVLRLFTSQVVTAIKNAERYESERRVADILQTALLAVPEHIEGLEYGYLYRPATEATKVGGDFFDIFELEHGRIGVIVGDVSGKGIEAASLTSLVRNTIKAYAYEEESPAAIMQKTNNAVMRATPASYFITLFLGIIEMKSGILTYCSAGHPPALLKRTTSGLQSLDIGSPILGGLVNINYLEASIELEKGDMLLLYTDGITEARCNGDFFGEERLIAFFEALQASSAKDIPDAVFDEVMDCTGGELSDDVVLLSLSLLAEDKNTAKEKGGG